MAGNPVADFLRYAVFPCERFEAVAERMEWVAAWLVYTAPLSDRSPRLGNNTRKPVTDFDQPQGNTFTP